MTNFKGLALGDLALIVSLVITVILALIALLTLREMIKQRKTAYRPDIIFEEDEFWLACDFDKDESPSISFAAAPQVSRREYSKISEGEKKYLDRPFYINAHNIGLGTAKFIDIEWTVDWQKFTDCMNAIDTKRKITFLINEEWNVLHFMIEGSFFSVLTKVEKLHFDSFLPISVRDNPYYVKLSDTYFNLLGFFIWKAQLFFNDSMEKFKDDPNSEQEFILNFEKKSWQLPPLHASVKFRDIGNNPHQKDFNLVFDLSHHNFTSREFMGKIDVIEDYSNGNRTRLHISQLL